MIRVNLTLDPWTDTMLKLLAMESNTSRSEQVRKLVQARVMQDTGLIKGFSELINKEK